MSNKTPRQSKFYFGNDQMQRDAGSLSMFTPLGTSDQTKSLVVANTAGTPSNVSISRPLPGIAVADYAIVPGISGNGSSAINIAAKKLYTFVRHQNSGSRNYDSPDLIEYVFSVIAAYVFLSQCIRCYAAVMRYAATNRYLGKQLVSALGWDYDDISKNLASFRTLININITKLNALKIPGDWNLLTRNLAMNMGIYKDGDIDKSQFYVYRSDVLWQYHETGTYIGSLTPLTPFGSDGKQQLNLSMTDGVFTAVINALVASEDINIMSGDILKAYGDKCFKMELIPENIAVEPMYDKDMLTLFHNLHFIEPSPLFTTNDGFIIWQDTSTNAIRFNPAVSSVQDWIGYTNGDLTNDYVTRNKRLSYFDFDIDDVKPSDILLASLGNSTISDQTNLKNAYAGTETCRYASFGTELFKRLTIWNHPAVYTGNSYISTTEIAYYNNVGSDLPAVVSKWVEELSKFDWCPLLYIVNTYEDHGANGYNPYIIGDMYNYTTVERTDLSKMHQCILLSSMNLD